MIISCNRKLNEKCSCKRTCDFHFNICCMHCRRAWSFIHHIIAWIARLLRLKREMLDAKEKQKPDDYAHGIEWMRSHTHTAHTSHLKDSRKSSSITYSINSTIYIDEPYRFEIQWKRYVNKAASSFIIGQVFCRFAFGHWMLLAIY